MSIPNINLKDLVESGVHFGHPTQKWNPNFKKFIAGQKNGIHIIDVNKSIQLNNQYPNSYDTRGYIKYQLNDFEGACNDMKKSIALGGTFSNEWFENEGKYCK